jgi:hypothetical protein
MLCQLRSLEVKVLVDPKAAITGNIDPLRPGVVLCTGTLEELYSSSFT